MFRNYKKAFLSDPMLIALILGFLSLTTLSVTALAATVHVVMKRQTVETSSITQP